MTHRRGSRALARRISDSNFEDLLEKNQWGMEELVANLNPTDVGLLSQAQEAAVARVTGTSIFEVHQVNLGHNAQRAIAIEMEKARRPERVIVTTTKRGKKLVSTFRNAKGQFITKPGAKVSPFKQLSINKRISLGLRALER